MAAPKDPKDKPVTLDLEFTQSTQKAPSPQTEPQAKEPTQVKFRSLDATVQKPSKTQNPPQRPARSMHNRTKTGRIQKPKNNSKPLFIVAGVLVTAVLAFQFMGSRSIPQTVSEKPAPSMKAMKAKPVTTEVQPQAAPPPVAVNDPYGQIRDANLDQLEPKYDDNGNTFFAIRVAPKPVCYPADVEAMRNVVGNSGSLLLSLEPMSDDAKSKAPISRTISLKEITQGTQISLPVNLKETGVYGIYICTDSTGTRSCKGKPAADFNKILNHKDLDVAANAVFYYQFSVVGLDYATVYSGTPGSIGSAREQLMNKKNGRDWKAELDKAAGMMRGVKSYPPRTLREDKAIVMELPIAMVNPNGSCR